MVTWINTPGIDLLTNVSLPSLTPTLSYFMAVIPIFELFRWLFLLQEVHYVVRLCGCRGRFASAAGLQRRGRSRPGALGPAGTEAPVPRGLGPPAGRFLRQARGAPPDSAPAPARPASPCPARRGGRCCPARSGGCNPGCAPPSSPRRGNPPSR